MAVTVEVADGGGDMGLDACNGRAAAVGGGVQNRFGFQSIPIGRAFFYEVCLPVTLRQLRNLS